MSSDDISTGFSLSFFRGRLGCYLPPSFVPRPHTGSYLTSRQPVVQGRSIGPVSEDSRQGHLLLHSHHLQPQQVSVYGLAINGLLRMQTVS